MTVKAGTVLILVVPYSLTFFSHRDSFGQDFKDRSRRIHSKDTVVLLEDLHIGSTEPMRPSRVHVLHQSGAMGFVELRPQEWEILQ